MIRAPVGEVNVAVRMRDEGAPIGGEGNGGVILPEVHLGRDAPVGAALSCSCCWRRGGRCRRSSRSYPRYVDREGQARPAERERSTRCTRRCGRRFRTRRSDTQDGLRLSWPDRWVHVRPSGTEPIVRVIAEAPDEAQARELVRRSREPLDALGAVAAQRARSL